MPAIKLSKPTSSTAKYMRLSIKDVLYYQLRFSFLYSMYLKYFRRPIYQSRQKELQFYAKLGIPSNELIFDIGANIGDKSALFRKIVKTVVAVEPDLRNNELLKRRFKNSSLVRIVNSAVGEEAGTALFHINISGSPANTLSNKWKSILEDPSANRWSKSLEFETSYEVDVVTLDILIQKFGNPFYIKIDVEGYELQALKGLNTSPPLLSFEANFPEFRQETLECIRELYRLSPRATFNCIDNEHTFFWDQHMEFHSMMHWLEQTGLKYFEVFCFRNS